MKKLSVLLGVVFFVGLIAESWAQRKPVRRAVAGVRDRVAAQTKRARANNAEITEARKQALQQRGEARERMARKRRQRHHENHSEVSNAERRKLERLRQGLKQEVEDGNLSNIEARRKFKGAVNRAKNN